MKRLAFVMSLLALVVSVVIVSIEAQGAKTPATKEIMGKLNKGPDCLNAKIGKELKAEQPDWPALQAETKEFAALASLVGQNDPPKGDKDSWATLTKAYATNARSMDAAAQNKDKEAAHAAHAAMAKSCKVCHTAHREM